MTRGWTRHLGVVMTTVLTLALPGCAAASHSGTSAAGSAGTVTIAVYPWSGYDADVAVVSRLLTDQLHYTVVTKKMTAKEAWPALADGSVDVVLENWGHGAEKKQYIEQQHTVVDLGPNGNKGVLGVYVPMWLALEHPDIRDWHNLNKYAHLFATPSSGGKGVILEGDTSYTTSDPGLIKGLGLNYTLTYSGSEDATVKAATAAEAQRKPLLFYFWEPHWLFQKAKFAKVNFPERSEGCDSDPDKVTCDYGVDDLGKVASAKFTATNSPAVQLLKNFQWTNGDQNLVAELIVNEHVPPAEAAQRWMDENPDIWQAWITG